MKDRVTSSPSLLPWILLVTLAGCVIGDDQGDAGQEGPIAASGPGTGDFDICEEACDPLEQSCASGSTCLPDGSFSCQVLPNYTLGLHEACDLGVQSCDAGLVCLGSPAPGCSGSTGCCIAICDLTSPQCSNGTQCTAYFGESASCFPQVGACVP